MRYQLISCVLVKDNLIRGKANLLVLNNVHLRSLDVANCGLGDIGLSKLWTGLSGQATSLEEVNTSENQGTVKFEVLRHSLSQLRTIRKLNIAGNTRIGSLRPLFDEAAINTWDLEELDVSGIAVSIFILYMVIYS